MADLNSQFCLQIGHRCSVCEDSHCVMHWRCRYVEEPALLWIARRAASSAIMEPQRAEHLHAVELVIT